MLKKIILLCLCMPLAVQATDLKDTPKCNDKRVLEVLSGAFAQQGNGGEYGGECGGGNQTNRRLPC